ncbi:Gypsy retrotransposon integrase-like protein 1 [Eumeta japonica]|uniref:RNA-directed DNA polymerase n=1 Tax=Eumeta variegata TaxID=151549 RepID=A0A4C1XXX1_EUMVA|nr:Gypsy retrotransposon integrase-like protein 1 [Eumeta japonica]
MKLQSFNLQVSYTPGKANVLADSLSRPPFETEARESCDVCTVLIDTPRWEATALRKDQLDDPELSKIIIGLENTNDLEVNRWTERGYHMCKGVLYRYTDTETEEPQLVVPENRRKQVMVECHDSATAGHGGINKTLHRISQQFYFPGMRRYVINYLKTCVECQRYKPDNLKPMGLLQTPVPAQRFEVVAVDLFGPLPKGPKGERWVMIMEDTASKWIELFPLADATAEACAKVLIEEVFLRFGVPRRMVSDNGVQFVADVMQKAMFILGVKQNLIPLYHPEANPVERKNRDLKTQLAILVEGHHNRWPEVLPFIRFAMNTALTKATLKTRHILLLAVSFVRH